MSAYIKDLDELDLSQYATPELVKLASRIITTAGADAGWKVLDAACDAVRAEQVDCCIAAARIDPDHPRAVQTLFQGPPMRDINGMLTITYPVMANIVYLCTTQAALIGESNGFKEAAFSELFGAAINNARIARMVS